MRGGAVTSVRGQAIINTLRKPCSITEDRVYQAVVRPVLLCECRAMINTSDERKLAVFENAPIDSTECAPAVWLFINFVIPVFWYNWSIEGFSGFATLPDGKNTRWLVASFCPRRLELEDSWRRGQPTSRRTQDLTLDRKPSSSRENPKWTRTEQPCLGCLDLMIPIQSFPEDYATRTNKKNYFI